jgi:hypothetical protein
LGLKINKSFMQDIFNLSNTSENIQVFSPNGSTAWQIWSKPRNISFVHVLCIGAGGGGGGGQAGSGNRAGGGGGGCGGISNGIFPSSIIPDILYINVSTGGAGGASGANGTAGGTSYVSMQPNTTAANVLLYANAGGFGQAAGTAGSAGTNFALGSANFAYYGILTTGAGIIGGTGGSNIGGNGNNIIITYPLSGGAGGGGATTGQTTLGNGGSIAGVGIIPTINGGITGGTLDGGEGYTGQLPSSSSSIRLPILFTGGAGGASGGASNGGKGGNGGIGSGGGGGGAGVLGGAGGNGGNGLIIITTF